MTPKSNIRRIGLAASAILASTALLAGCSSSGSTPGTNASGTPPPLIGAGIIGDQPEAGDPVTGGSLSFAGYSMPSSLDPTKTQASGSTGGTEMANIYDLLVRYDAETGQFTPQLAETLTEGDDHLTWSLGLRDGVTFSDGTPLDADAVVASINRYNQSNGAKSQQFKAGVTDVAATAPNTVVFTLNAPWAEFPALLTFGHGMVVASSAYADPDNFAPIGAGPFTVDSFAPSSSLTLVPRADYWDGQPRLDSLKFLDIAGDQPRIQNLDSDVIQMTFLRSPEWVTKAKSEYPGFYEPLSLSDVILVNNRDGRPGADIDVRRAIALAIDPDVINERAFNGSSNPTSKVFPEWSIWHNEVPAGEYDPEQSKKLLDQSKSAGYNGKIAYVTANNPASQAIALATQSMLNSVGFEVEIQYAATVTDLVKRLYVNHDFDVANAGYSVPDSRPLLHLGSALKSDSSSNGLGYNSPEMDALLAAGQQATTESAKRDAMRAIEQKIHDDVPVVPVGSGANFVAWNPAIYGAVPSSDGIMLLGKSWIQK